MLCALSVRRIRAGTFDRFREAWEPEEFPPQFLKAYHVRSVEDENQVVSFGFFEGDMSQYEQVSSDERMRRVEEARQRAMAEFVEETIVDGVFEVVDEVAGSRSAAGV